MPNMQNLPEQVQPMSGDASIEAALAAMTPEQAQTFMAGGNPYYDGNMPAINGYAPGVFPTGEGMSPEQRIAVAQEIQNLLSSLPKPTTPEDAAFSASLMDALQALSGGGIGNE